MVKDVRNGVEDEVIRAILENHDSRIILTEQKNKIISIFKE